MRVPKQSVNAITAVLPCKWDANCYVWHAIPVPLGPIHLIATHDGYDTESVMYCGAVDVIAAIHPSRVPEYAWELICPVCLAMLRKENGATDTHNGQPG